MKAFNTIKLKALTKKIATLGFVAALAIGCGKSDKNKVNTNEVVNQNTSSNPLNFGNNTQASNTWNNLKSGLNCQAGPRMNDLIFELQGSTQNGRLFGNLAPSGGVSGTVNQAYFGHTMQTNDLYAVSQVSDGNGIRYFVTVSFCSFIQGNYEVLGNNTQLGNFRMDVYLDNSISCQAGNILQGNIEFQNQNVGPDGRSITLISGECF